MQCVFSIQESIVNQSSAGWMSESMGRWSIGVGHWHHVVVVAAPPRIFWSKHLLTPPRSQSRFPLLDYSASTAASKGFFFNRHTELASLRLGHWWLIFTHYKLTHFCFLSNLYWVKLLLYLRRKLSLARHHSGHCLLYTGWPSKVWTNKK